MDHPVQVPILNNQCSNILLGSSVYWATLKLESNFLQVCVIFMYSEVLHIGFAKMNQWLTNQDQLQNMASVNLPQFRKKYVDSVHLYLDTCMQIDITVTSAFKRFST